MADAVYRRCLDAERDFAAKLWRPDEAVAHAIRQSNYAKRPIVLADTQDNPGGLVAGPGESYFAAFSGDTLNLSPDYQIHFDLYNTDVTECSTKRGGNPNALCPDVDAGDFAPFSHDAQSPEPGTMMLVGLGLGAAALYRRATQSRAV